MRITTFTNSVRCAVTVRLTVLLPILFALVGCRGASQPANITSQAVQVDVVSSSAAGAQVLTASLQPYAQVQLSFKSGGPVDWIQQAGAGSGRHTLSPGDFVRRGQVMAHVRLLDYEQKLSISRAALVNAEAVENAAAASQKLAELDQARSQALYGGGSLTKPDMDKSQANFDSANASVAQAKAGTTTAQYQMAEALTALRDASLAAPFDGTVSDCEVELGVLVTAGQPAFTFLDIGRVKAIFSVGSSLLNDLHPGQSIPISIQGVAQPVTGIITSIAPAADAKTRVFEVEVTIPNPHGNLRPGMTGQLQVASTLHSGHVLTLPLSALVEPPSGKGNFAVYTLTDASGDGIAHLQPVDVGEMVGNSVVVRRGLLKGQKIITSGATLLHDGQHVRVTP